MESPRDAFGQPLSSWKDYAMTRVFRQVSATTISEPPHSLIMLLVPWKRLIFGPPFLFQFSNNMHPRRRSRLVTPKFARLLNARKVMVQLAVAHPVRRLARKLIQPVMHLFKR